MLSSSAYRLALDHSHFVSMVIGQGDWAELEAYSLLKVFVVAVVAYLMEIGQVESYLGVACYSNSPRSH